MSPQSKKHSVIHVIALLAGPALAVWGRPEGRRPIPGDSRQVHPPGGGDPDLDLAQWALCPELHRQPRPRAGGQTQSAGIPATGKRSCRARGLGRMPSQLEHTIFRAVKRNPAVSLSELMEEDDYQRILTLSAYNPR